MRTPWKRAAALALALLLTGGLWSCGREGRDDGEHEPITITRFNNLITEDFLDALHQVYPEINLRIVSYGGGNGSAMAQYSLENDDTTDIYVSTQAFHKELYPERLIDLSSYDFVNNYSTFMLNSLDVNGGIYLLPTGYTVSGMWYNKTILEENGWAVPASFEELVALVPAIEAAGYQPFANAMDLGGYPFNYFFSLGNTVYFSTQDGAQWKEDFPLGLYPAGDSQGLRLAAEYYGEWVERGIITDKHTSVRDYQESGNIVFYLCLGLSRYEYETLEGKIWEFGIMPWLSRDGSANMLTRNVSRYFGISKRLSEPGNEQKLQDALHVLEFVSSEAGQEAIMSSANIYMSPLNGGKLAEDNPYQEVAEVMNAGHSVQMVYVGWEDLLVPIAQDIRALTRGEISPEELPGRFDQTYREVVAIGSGDVFGTLTEGLTYEETGALCAIAEGRAAMADCALVSLNEYHGDDCYNSKGAAWRLWEGKINTEKITMISPASYTITVLTMTGAEIKALQAAGFDFNENGRPYDYLLVTKGGMPLEDSVVYRLAVGSEEIPAALRESGETVYISAVEAVMRYVSDLGVFGAADIVWR